MFGAALQSASALPLGLLRNAVSGSKVRFVSEGYDLDLTYVTARIIAMGLPAESLEAAWRNSLGEVANFLHSKHPQCHRVYNLCDERDYDAARFHAALHLPFPDHHPPSLDALLLFVADARAWLLSDTQNVVAVHCKAGKGRTGVMITALLMALDWPGCASAHEALAVFRARRTRDGDACRNAGQVRYVHYYEKILGGFSPPPRRLRLLRLELRRLGANRAGYSRRMGAGALSNVAWGALDSASGADAANPLSAAGGSSVLLKVRANGQQQISLESPFTLSWPTANGQQRTVSERTLREHTLAERTLGEQNTRSLTKLSAWFAEPGAVLTASLGHIEVSTDMQILMVAGGALGMVQERLWRLDVHCAMEELHTDPKGPTVTPAAAALSSAAEAAAIAPPKQALPGPAPSGPDLQVPPLPHPLPTPQHEAAPADAPAATAAAAAAAAAAVAVAVPPQETYLRFEREGLDDCRGFANQHDFELRVYVQQLS